MPILDELCEYTHAEECVVGTLAVDVQAGSLLQRTWPLHCVPGWRSHARGTRVALFEYAARTAAALKHAWRHNSLQVFELFLFSHRAIDGKHSGSLRQLAQR